MEERVGQFVCGLDGTFHGEVLVLQSVFLLYDICGDQSGPDPFRLRD
jgi:hypothetical protein